MSAWPGDSAPLPHQAPEDRLGARLAGMVGEPERVVTPRSCRACGKRGSNRHAAIAVLGRWTA